VWKCMFSTLQQLNPFPDEVLAFKEVVMSFLANSLVDD
jgi:hypothetical protein